MKGKQGKSDIENGIMIAGGIAIAIFFIVTLLNSGIFAEIIKSFASAFGAIGAFLGILFIILIILAVFENIKRK